MTLNEATLVGVSIPGVESGDHVLAAVAALNNAIKAHVEAASGNDAFIQEAGRRSEIAHRLMTSLAGATFPDGHHSLARVVQVLSELEMRAGKWNKSSKWVQRLAQNRSGISKASKYRDLFQQLFALLDRALQELMDAVQVDSCSNLSALRAEYQAEVAGLDEKFSAAVAAARADLTLEEVTAAAAARETVRAHANALAKIESQLDSALQGLEANFAQAATKAAAAVAEAMHEPGSRSGGGSSGGGAADNTDEIVDALKAKILDHVVPEFLESLTVKCKLAQQAKKNGATEAHGQGNVGGGLPRTQQAGLEPLRPPECESTGEEMAKQYVFDPYDSDDDHEKAFLGGGAFGDAYRMVNKNDMQSYAVKLINVKRSRLTVPELQNEHQVLKRLNHPNITVASTTARRTSIGPSQWSTFRVVL